MDVKAMQAVLALAGVGGKGGDWADAVCERFTAEGGPVQCSPLAGSALTVTAAGKNVQAGSGTPSPDNIRALTGVGEGGTLTLTAAGSSVQTAAVPLDAPLYDGDGVTLAADGTATERHTCTRLALDGSEDWIQWNSPSDTADYTVDGTIGDIDTVLCSHYKKLEGNLVSDGLYTFSLNTTAEPGRTRIILRHGYRKLADFKAYLAAQAKAGTPVTLLYRRTDADAAPVVTTHRAAPLRADTDADGLCTVQGEGPLTVTGYEDPRATRRALEQRVAALEAKA